jgi:hypothetical protein
VPTPTLSLDLVKDAQIENRGLGRAYIRRMGILRDIDTTVDPSLIFAQATQHPDMPVIYSAFPHPAYGTSLLMKHVFEPITNTKLRVALLYEPADVGTGGGIAFVVTRRTYLVDTETQLHPERKQPFNIVWKNPRDPQQRTKPDVATLRYRMPIQVVTASGWVRSADLPEAAIACIGKVNEKPWRGKPKGYWLCEVEDDKTEDRGRSYTLQFQFTTKITEDWSSWAIFRDLPVRENDIAGLKAVPYRYGFEATGGNATNHVRNGIIKAGMYPTADFGAIFGFGAD